MGVAALLLAGLLGTAGPFTLVNGTGAGLRNLSIRAADASSRWASLRPADLPAGTRANISPPSGDLCAFDIRARVDGSDIIWPSVNLCDVRIVILNRRPDGTLWVDYD